MGSARNICVYTGASIFVMTRSTSTINTTAKMSNGVEILNRVPRDKLSQVLSHILDKRVAQADAKETGGEEVFSVEEIQQLTAMLQLSERDINDVVAAATAVFQETAAFGEDQFAIVLQGEGLERDVVAVIEKLWRKRGRVVSEKLATALPFDASIKTLTRSDWRLQLELGNRFLSNQSDPKAIFQLAMEGRAGAKEEKLDIEMDHGELFAFFQQLNAIQKELDDGNSTVAAAP